MLGPGVTEGPWALSVSILKRSFKLLIDLTNLDPNPEPEHKSRSF